MVGWRPASILGEPEHALTQDVLENLGGAGADAAAAGQQLIELPLAVVGRPLRPFRDLRIGPDHLGGGERELLVELAPEQLGGGTLGARLSAAQDLGEA